MTDSFLELTETLNTDLGDPIESLLDIDEYMRSLPLEERIEAAKTEISHANARGECVHCAESFARSRYDIPEKVKLVKLVTRPATETVWEIC